MATLTLGAENQNTAAVNTLATGSFTPAANDLLAGGGTAAGSVTDPGTFISSDAGKTYSSADVALFNASANTVYAFSADQLADADIQTATLGVVGDDSTGMTVGVVRIGGMTLTGASARRQVKVVENQAASDVDITFDNPCLAGNPVLIFMGKTVQTAVTPPTGFSTLVSQAHGTPNIRFQIMGIEDADGITLMEGGASDGLWGAVAIEFDASAGGGGLSIPVAEQYFRRQRAA